MLRAAGVESPEPRPAATGRGGEGKAATPVAVPVSRAIGGPKRRRSDQRWEVTEADLNMYTLIVGRAPSEAERVAALTPVPADVSREKVLDLDAKTLTRWKEALAWTW